MRFGRVLPPRSGVLSLPTTTETNVGVIVPANLDGPLAVAGWHVTLPYGLGRGLDGASWSSLRESTRTLRGSDVGKCTFTGVSSGL